jgi:hypothetical protein
MSTRIAGMHVAAFVVLLCSIATAQVLPQPTEVDKAYYYSTIGQELAYAKIREDAYAARKPDKVAPSVKPQIGEGLPPSPLQTPTTISPLSSRFCPGISALCPSPSQLMSRLEAAGCRL